MNNCFKITDERFNTDRTDFYDLIFEIQFSRFRFIILSNDSVIWLEDHYLGIENDLPTTLEKIKNIFTTHSFLKIPYWKSIKVISDFQVHTLLENNSHTSSKNEEYIKICFPTINLSYFEVYSEKAGNHTVVFALVKTANQLFREYYPEGKFHFTSSTYVGINYNSSLATENTLCILSDSYLNSFYLNPKTKTPITTRIPLSQISTFQPPSQSLKIYGEITPYSTAYRLLNDRYTNIIMGETPNEGKLPIGFTEVSSQRYFTLMAAL
jgi:hypothetical protein